MKLKFWGVRGSIPSPDPETNKYGGNTTCLEIRTNNNDLIVIDGGTGIHKLAQELLTQMPINAHILITHTHWDHIHGLPFCTPIYIAGNQLTFYGGQDLITGQGIERTLTIQMQHSFFPIEENELQADITYKTVKAHEVFKIADATITPILLNHPVINFGYRIDCDGSSLFFTGDYEQPLNIYEPEDKAYAEFQMIIDERVAEIVESIKGVDVLIMDTSFTDEEYLLKKNWGHGTYTSAIELAQKAEVKKLFFTHHEPTRTDTQLDEIYEQLLHDYADVGFEFIMAQERLEVIF